MEGGPTSPNDAGLLITDRSKTSDQGFCSFMTAEEASFMRPNTPLSADGAPGRAAAVAVDGAGAGAGDDDMVKTLDLRVE